MESFATSEFYSGQTACAGRNISSIQKHINEGNVKWVYHLGEGYS